jgi:hypothetical protein
MKDFKSFGIKAPVNGFTGDKIKIDRILNKRVIIHKYKIEGSKFTEKGNGKCMTVQIEIDSEKRIFFTSSMTLMEMIKQVPETDFPFGASIERVNERLEFT